MDMKTPDALKEPDKLSAGEISKELTGKWAGRSLYYFDTTGSTNADAKEKLAEGNPEGTLVVADMQTEGRGRRGRSWSSPKGDSIYMSLGLKPVFSPDKASMVTLVMALAIAKTVRTGSNRANTNMADSSIADTNKADTNKADSSIANSSIIPVEAMIKWPNDIVVNGKKVCGILTELNLEKNGISSLVIGVGINVNGKDFPQEIKETATSLFLETGQKFSRAQLIADIMEQFEKEYEKFVAKEDLSELLEEYNSFLINRDKKVKVLDPKEEWEGIARGINEKGELLVETSLGQIVEVYAGEVSVRGLFGYV